MESIPIVRFGILGTAKVARALVRGLSGSNYAVIDAIASRSKEQAAAFAHEMSVNRSYGDYDALLADDRIDAVYIPLPNDLHAKWVVRAAEAGKHILCEKPLALSEHQARRMFAAAKSNNVLLAEAYPYMSQPPVLHLRSLLAQGTLGAIQTVYANFGFSICSPQGEPLPGRKNIRFDPERGGGALLDAGAYAMSFARLVLGECPRRVNAVCKYTNTGVDQTLVATLEFPSGAFGQISCSLSTAFYRNAIIVAENGVVETSFNNHAETEASLSIRVKRGRLATEPFELLTFPAGNGFRAEAESFAAAVRLGYQHWNGASSEESLDTIKSLEAIANSVKTGAWSIIPARIQ